MNRLISNTINYRGEVLNEVKAGSTGRGLLIESDGLINHNCDLVKQIHEDISNHKEFVIPDRFIVSAVFQKYGIKNANGRIYPEEILKREVAKYIEEKINTNMAIGALDHPASSALSGHDVSHRILNVEWQGHTLVGELELHLSPGYRKLGICSTSGDLAANLILDGIQIGVSSRGVGSVEQKYGDLVVGDDFEIVALADLVCEPSTRGAYIKMNRKELQPFIEGKSDSNLPSLNEKLTKINNLLLN